MGTSAHITAVRNGKDIQTISADMQDGKYKLVLAAGVYTIKVSVADSPFPLHVNNIMVKSGDTAELPPIELTVPSGTGGLSLKVTPSRRDIELKLIYERKERAAVHVGREGKYEFKEMPAGACVAQANAPGNADDAITVLITDNQKIEQNAVLLPIVAIELQEKSSPWATACRREMAKRAALANSQRNMLNTIVQIRIDANQSLKTAMRGKKVALNIDTYPNSDE